VIIVIWAIAIAAVVLAGTQLVTFRQATMGREALARVQARWAARAGIEECIAVLEYHASRPAADDAMMVYRDLEATADGELRTGSWSIRHTQDGVEKPGPQDEHAKANINRLNRQQLLALDNMTFDVADAILDWRDADHEVQGLGAERDYYLNRNLPYTPRNANFRSIAELELVAGAWPAYVRGEDMNLNGRLDPNENDGNMSPPNDDADGLLDAGWSGILTAYTTVSRIGASGEPKLYLRDATTEEIKARFGVDDQQAAALSAYAKTNNATLEVLLVTDLGSLGQTGQGRGRGGAGATGAGGRTTGRSSTGAGGNRGQPGQSAVKPLDTNQLRLIFREGTLDRPTEVVPGKININTAPEAVLRRVLNIDGFTVDAILGLRASKTGGITSVVDLLGSSRITPETLAGLASQIDTTSQVFTITSRGRSESTGLEVEITAVVDRSTLPARIIEYREN
jgi:type II secretory pathway component PulK